MTTAPPVVPTADQLKDLNPTVAVVLLIVIALFGVLVWFGGPIRDRLTKKPAAAEDKRPAELAAAIRDGAPPVATTAADRAAQVEDAYRGNLLEQIRKLEERVAAIEEKYEESERRNDQLVRENAELRHEMALDRARWRQP